MPATYPSRPSPGCDLRHNRVGARADVRGRAGHLRMAIPGEHDAHRDRHLQGLPDTSRHAPADQLVAVAHRARLWLALGPAKRLSALAVAFAQALAAVGSIRDLVVIRITPQAKLKRVELQRHRKLVHRTLERVDARCRAWGAHVA